MPSDRSEAGTSHGKEHYDPVIAMFMCWVAIGVVTAITLYASAILLTFGTAGMVAALGMALFGSGLVWNISKSMPGGENA